MTQLSPISLHRNWENNGSKLYVTDVFVAQFIPLDALATAVLYWFVFGVVYQTLAVRTGLAPFTPGAGNESQYPWSFGPFK
ncbi:MAG: hypothetical protein QW506_03020 [Thermoproteota archaeon]